MTLLNKKKAISEARALQRQGRIEEAIKKLQRLNRSLLDTDIELELVKLRGDACSYASRSKPRTLETVECRPKDSKTVPVINADELSAREVRIAISSYGSVLVKKLLDPARASRLRDSIDRAINAFMKYSTNTSPRTAWFYPYERMANHSTIRSYVTSCDSILTVDSPRALFWLIETFEELKIDQLVSDFFGERPAISAEKCTLRRLSPALHEADWHQDGAFLGTDILALNIWIALSPCGRNAPGLEIVSRRVNEVLATGTEGAAYPWSISSTSPELAQLPKMTPEFNIGDALLFDHLLPHRSAHVPNMNKQRYSCETWFFAPSKYPASQTPLAL